MIRLIADSGSTKTEWCICQRGEILQRFSTQGINPFHQSTEEIEKIIKLMAKGTQFRNDIKSIEFFGAGCAFPEKQEMVKNVLKATMPHVTLINVASDLMGAALSVCQGKAGIACILGTGSNSCQFDGTEIVANTPSLGYILGDEGSGATLGRTLASNCLKGLLPDNLCKAFLSEYNLDQATLLNKVYRQPLANRYLASFTPFLSKYREEPAIQSLLKEQFTCFFQRNIMNYDCSLPIHFVGSIAYYFQPEITKVAKIFNLKMGQTIQAPMDGLIKTENF